MVRVPWLWAIIPIVASEAFLFRFAFVRPHLLSVALAFIVLWSAARGRLLILAVASAIYPWAYVAWFIPVFLVCIVETSRYFSGEHIRLKPLLIAFSGIITGVLLHPNTLNLLRLAWIQVVGVLFRTAWGQAVGFDLGAEFLPPTQLDWIYKNGLCALILIFALILSWRNRKSDSITLAFALTALAFGALTIKSTRFFEYLVPFSVAALALASRSTTYRFLPYILVFISLNYSFSLKPDEWRQMTDITPVMQPATIDYLRRHIPPGVQIFSPDWDLTGTLMLAIPDRRFIVALDPTFFYEKDHELYRLWYDISHGKTHHSAQQILQKFNARYVISYNRDKWYTFLQELSKTSGVKMVIIDNNWVLFDLAGANH